MSSVVRDAYDARAREYADLFLDHLDRVPFDRAWIAAFAHLVAPDAGFVADVGCGPGNVVHHLAELGVAAVGYDLSPAMIEEARRAFPDLDFRVGDLAGLHVADASLAGIVARYSLIHVSPERFPFIFREWFRVLEPGAPVLVSFFASSSPRTHGRAFDHAVVTAHELFPDLVVQELQSAGFDRFDAATREPQPGERQLDHGTILARRSHP